MLLHTDAFTRKPFYTQKLSPQFLTLDHHFASVFDTRPSFRAKGLRANLQNRNLTTRLDIKTYESERSAANAMLSYKSTILPRLCTIEPHFVRKSCAGPVKIAILFQFLAIEPRFVRKGFRSTLQIAIAPQFLVIEARFVRKGCDRRFKIAISPQFLAIEARFVQKGCVSCRLVGTAPRLKREIETKEKERAREQEGKRARGQERM